MNFEDYRTLFVVGTLVVALLVVSPALGVFVSFPRSGESFSELWVLGQHHTAEDYPFNVRTGEPYSLFLGVGNRVGYAAYYVVYAKFRNQSQPLPVSSSSEASPLLSVHEFRFFLVDGDVWEQPLMFEILSVITYGDSLVVEGISINKKVFQVSCSAVWDSENSGFYFQLFFELWSYDPMGSSFRFNGRFVGIWLNITG